MGTRAIPPPLAGLGSWFTVLPVEATHIAVSIEVREAWSLVCRWRGR